MQKLCVSFGCTGKETCMKYQESDFHKIEKSHTALTVQNLLQSNSCIYSNSRDEGGGMYRAWGCTA